MPHRSDSIHKLGSNCVVFNTSINDRVINLWFRIICNVNLSIFGKGNMIQAEDYGGAYLWTRGNNTSVVNSASILDSNLSKNHLVICYHGVRDASAAGIW